MDTNLYQLANDDEYECDEVNSLTDHPSDSPKAGIEIEVDILNDIGFQWGRTFVKNDVVDWSRLQYQNTYKTFEFYANKFPPGFEKFPGFTDIINSMAANAKTPMEEIEERYNVAEIHNEHRYDTNISEFKDC